MELDVFCDWACGSPCVMLGMLLGNNSVCDMEMITILQGDVVERLRELPDHSVHCVVTSPPYYGLRDYQIEGQIGLEDTPEAYVKKIVEVFREVKRVMRDDGTLWLNLGDSYNSGSGGYDDRYDGDFVGRTDIKDKVLRKGRSDKNLKPKDMLGIPWMVAFALRADGWYLWSDIIWSKPNPMPESVTDRPTKSHEYIFLLTKKAHYYYDADAIREPHKPESLNRYEYGLHSEREKREQPFIHFPYQNQPLKTAIEWGTS